MMLRGDPVPPETLAKMRRPPTLGSPGVLLALTPPPTAGRTEALWPSWLSPIGASWKRPAAAPNADPSQRSE